MTLVPLIFPFHATYVWTPHVRVFFNLRMTTLMAARELRVAALCYDRTPPGARLRASRAPHRRWIQGRRWPHSLPLNSLPPNGQSWPSMATRGIPRHRPRSPIAPVCFYIRWWPPWELRAACPRPYAAGAQPRARAVGGAHPSGGLGGARPHRSHRRPQGSSTPPVAPPKELAPADLRGSSIPPAPTGLDLTFSSLPMGSGRERERRRGRRGARRLKMDLQQGPMCEWEESGKGKLTRANVGAIWTFHMQSSVTWVIWRATSDKMANVLLKHLSSDKYVS
jgi:hypothetical protein